MKLRSYLCLASGELHLIHRLTPCPVGRGGHWTNAKPRQLLGLLLFTWSVASAAPALSAQSTVRFNQTPFWLGVHSNQQVDVQARRLMSELGSIAVLRLFRDGRDEGAKGSQFVAQLREAAPDMPILIYGWVDRYLKKGCTGDQMMNWLVREPGLQLQFKPKKGRPIFGDVRNDRYRGETVSNIAKVVDLYGADGIGIDVAFRTPTPRPGLLARRCDSDREFCTQFAGGMDKLFQELRGALGTRKIVYNGLWNFRDGMVKDQARLLAHADAAIVEYFGMEPKAGRGSFGQDILPYLEAMDGLPANKHIYVYGRGPWQYEDYDDDYQRQRYLFASYLLAARTNTSFKYQSSFQVPAHAGRSGGLDLYADALLPLGTPSGPRREDGNLLSRVFSHGLVVVSPQGSAGGSTTLEHAMYTPEGVQLREAVAVAPGSALILLDAAPPPPAEQHAIALEPLADWRGAEWKAEPNDSAYLELKEVSESGDQGNHDLILDGIRSTKPFPTIDLRVQAKGTDSRLLLIAEVDDQERRRNYVAVCVGTAGATNCAKTISVPRYRIPGVSRKERWPAFAGPEMALNLWSNLTIDGDELLRESGFRFRRWAYMRIQGEWIVSRVELLRKHSK